MSESQTAKSREPRISFAAEVEIRFEDFDDFVTEYSRDLSLNGMFLKTTRPHPPGSSFQFEFQVAGGQPLIRGVGEVVWVREPNEARQVPPGMGVRFISIDSNGQKLLRWLIERNLAEGDSSLESSASTRRPASRTASPAGNPGSSAR